MRRPTVIFNRVSSADQRDGFSLEAQNRLSEKYVKENNLLVFKTWSVDESASKEKDRKYFFEMIKYLRENDISDVVFDKVDRACRGLKSADIINDLIEDEGVRFHFTRENLIINKDSPSSEKLRFYLGVILGKYYIDNLKTEIKKGMDEREKKGHWNYKAPIGYLNCKCKKTGKAIVEVDPLFGPVIKEVFEMYSTGNYTIKMIQDFLKSKAGNKTISSSLIENLLLNPFYYGHMRVKNKTLPANHEKLISKELFDSCQKIRGIRAAGHQRNRSNTIPKPLMGLMSCGECNHKVTGEVKRKSSGKTYIYYHCANLDCPQRRINVSEQKIFAQITEAFKPFDSFTPKATAAFVEMLHGGLENIDLYTQKKMGDLAETRLEIKKKMQKIEKLRSNKTLDEEEYLELIETKNKQLKEKNLEIEAYLASDIKTFKMGLNIIELLRKSYEFMELDDNLLNKAKLAKIVLSNPILMNGTLCYSYKNPFDVLTKIPLTKSWWSVQGSNL